MGYFSPVAVLKTTTLSLVETKPDSMQSRYATNAAAPAAAPAEGGEEVVKSILFSQN